MINYKWVFTSGNNQKILIFMLVLWGIVLVLAFWQWYCLHKEISSGKIKIRKVEQAKLVEKW